MTADEIAALREHIESMTHVLPLRSDERFSARVVAADHVTFASCGSEGIPDEWRARRDLIIAAVNALPALLSLAEDAARLRAALTEIETICVESPADCRKRMGTRVGNSLVTARAALAPPEGK